MLLSLAVPSSGYAQPLSNILIANLPQVILSFLYMMYNGLYTCMLLGHEWSSYAHQRKPLRVTSPSGKQRSTRWLQLPYHYSIPLLVLSGFMHWLVSQSLFLARVAVHMDTHDSNSVPEQENVAFTTCGYSPIALIFAIGLGALMLIALVLTGTRWYRPGIPLASSCSAAINAACHRPARDSDAAMWPLKWGEIYTRKQWEHSHCSFTSVPGVTHPVPGRLYR